VELLSTGGHHGPVLKDIKSLGTASTEVLGLLHATSRTRRLGLNLERSGSYKTILTSKCKDA